MRESDAGRMEDKDAHSRPQHYTTTDLMSTEDQVSAGIAGLVVMLQPELVVETGSHTGTTSRAIGEALKTNGHGALITYEVREAFANAAVTACAGLPVQVRRASSLTAQFGRGTIDVLFLDSGEETRPLELKHFWPAVRPGGIVIVHDTSVHAAKVAAPIIALLPELGGRWIEMHTPRGLMLIERTP